MYKLLLPILLIFTSNFYPLLSNTITFPKTYEKLNGKFEIHVTVSTESDLEYFKKTCETSKEIIIKPVLIELPYGETATQLMTSSSLNGTFFDVFKDMKLVVAHLEKNDFKVIRKKIELKIENSQGIPQTLDEMCDFPSSNYFEYHIKVAYPEGKDLSELAKLAKTYEAHLSRSALKQLADSKVKERFLTLRFYNLPLSETNLRRDLLIENLRTNNWEVAKIENEYAVYDTNVDIDRGWISKK